jgi:hypothetical protein
MHTTTQTQATSLRWTGALALTLILGHALTPTAAEARLRSSTFTGPHGQTATRNVSRQQGDVNSSTTGPNGRTASRSVDRSPGSTQATVTGPNGQTATRSTSYGDGSSTSTVTGPNGQSGTVTRTVQP